MPFGQYVFSSILYLQMYAHVQNVEDILQWLVNCKIQNIYIFIISFYFDAETRQTYRLLAMLHLQTLIAVKVKCMKLYWRSNFVSSRHVIA